MRLLREGFEKKDGAPFLRKKQEVKILHQGKDSNSGGGLIDQKLGAC